MVHFSENIQTSLLLRFHVLKQGYKKEEIPIIDILSRPEKHTNICVLQIPRAKTRLHLPPACSLRHVRHFAHVGLVDVYEAVNFFERNFILGVNNFQTAPAGGTNEEQSPSRYVGLNFTPASHFQIFRGSLIIFTGLLRVICFFLFFPSFDLII